jgi:GTPase SAR1 family protein
MSEKEKIEFRVFLIGDENCGKKTIINRFKNLKCSETIIKEKKNSKKYNEIEAKNYLLPLPDLIHPKIKSNLKSNINSNLNLDLISNQNKYREKQKPNNFYQEKIINNNNNIDKNNSKNKNKNINNNPISLQNINFLKNKLKNLTNFTKIFNLPKFYFEMNFFNCPTAETIDFNDKVNEEEDCETLHRMRLEKLNRFLKNEINKQNKNAKEIISSSSPLKIKYLFMFIYDITNKQSLKRLKIYYKEIYKIFFIENQNHNRKFLKILIGNKIDKKAQYPFNEEDKNFLMDFILETEIKYYEISGKLNFNFEKFFEKMFYEVIGNGNEVKIDNINTDYFKTKFSLLLYATNTFSKEKRDNYKLINNDNIDNKNITNDYNNTHWVGPGRYENNKYELNGEKGKEIFFNILIIFYFII